MTEEKWFKQRSYAHFDRGLSRKKASQLVMNPREVAKHSYFPLIVRVQKNTSRKVDYQSGLRMYKTKKRMIAYASHADSHIYAYYAQILNAKLEDRYLLSPLCNESVLAYRAYNPPRNNIHFAVQVFASIKRIGNCEVFALDVEGFFDNIQHKYLKDAWKKLLQEHELPEDHYAVFKAATRSPGILWHVLKENLNHKVYRRRGRKNNRICDLKVFREKVAPHVKPLTQLLAEIKKEDIPQQMKGIPQGLPISATLANLYMLEADKHISQVVHRLGGKYWRYSDDILLVVPPGKSAEAIEMVEGVLSGLGLNVQATKTQYRFCVKDVNDNLLRIYQKNCHNEDVLGEISYLGFDFDGESILVRPSTVSRFMIKARRTVKRAKNAALKNSSTLKRRKLYTQLTELGYGAAYGRRIHQMGHGQRVRKNIPRTGFFRYVHMAQKIIKAIDSSMEIKIDKQIRQLNNWSFRMINKEKYGQ